MAKFGERACRAQRLVQLPFEFSFAQSDACGCYSRYSGSAAKRDFRKSRVRLKPRDFFERGFLALLKRQSNEKFVSVRFAVAKPSDSLFLDVFKDLGAGKWRQPRCIQHTIDGCC